MMTKDQIRAALDSMPDPFSDEDITVGEFRAKALKWLGDYYLTVINSLQAALDAQDDMVLVPREPSETMIQKAYDSGNIFNRNGVVMVYRAMIAAAEKQ